MTTNQEYKIFLPNYKITFIMVVCFTILLGLTIYMINALLLSKQVQTLIYLIYLAINLSSWIVCIPLVRSHFAIKITPEKVRGPNGLIPMFSEKINFHWSQMKKIQIKNFLFFDYLEISNVLHVQRNDQTQKLIILIAIENYDEFVQLVLKYSPIQCPLRLVAEYPWGKIGDQRILEVTLSGFCHDSAKKIVPFIPVQLMKNEILIAESKTDMKGKYYFELSLIPSEYTLLVDSAEIGLHGKLTIKIERGYYKNLVIPLTR